MDIFSEISKEQKANELESQASKDYETLFSRYFGSSSGQKSHLHNFLLARVQVSRWARSTPDAQRKNQTQTAPNLSRQERTSLRVFYELYSELKNKQNDFSSQLKNLNQQTEETIPENLSKDFSNIQKALQRIWWERDRTRMVGTGSMYHEKWEASSWPKWEANPFKYFYDSEEQFLKDFEWLNSLRSKLYKQRASLKTQISQSPKRGQEVLKRQERAVKGDIDGNYSYRHIESQVAKKLLKDINKLD